MTDAITPPPRPAQSDSLLRKALDKAAKTADANAAALGASAQEGEEFETEEAVEMDFPARVIQLKIEKQEKEIENEFRKDLAEVRRVMYMCYALATVIAWYLTWGHKG